MGLFRRVGRIFRDTIGGFLGGGGSSQDDLLRKQNQLLEEKRKQTEAMLKAQELKAQEDAKIAEETAKEQTELNNSQNEENIDFGTSNTSEIDTSWLDGVIDENLKTDGTDENIIV